MAVRKVMNKSDFSIERYGESKFSRLYNRMTEKYPGSAQELSDIGYDPNQKKLTVAQQNIIIKYMH